LRRLLWLLRQPRLLHHDPHARHQGWRRLHPGRRRRRLRQRPRRGVPGDDQQGAGVAAGDRRGRAFGRRSPLRQPVGLTMPPLMVWALVTGERGVLLVPARAVDGWLLPGGPLRDHDESVESAVMREVITRFGVQLAEEPEFLDTVYERRPDGSSVVHNLFHVPSALLGSGIERLGENVRWLSPEELEGESLPAWLRDGVGPLYGLGTDELEFDFGEVERALSRFAEQAALWIITGPAGAGKSTVARELCRRYERSAHVEVD